MDINEIIGKNCDLNTNSLKLLIKSKKLNKKDNSHLSNLIKANNQIKEILQYCVIKTKLK